MKRIALAALPLLFATPSFAADFDGPRYGERKYIERREVIREEPPRVVEHYHYHQNVTPRVHVEERIYREPRGYAYHDRSYHHYDAWRPRHHFWHRPWRHHDDRRW
jgi:hypothetical protein